jgi:tol-pal system protein YbgF
MRKLCTIALAGAWLAAAVPAPVAAADREHQQMMADIRMLQEQSQQLAIALTTLADALKTISSRMDQQTTQQAEATRKLFADQKLLIDNMSTDLRVIRERSDETNVRISSLDQEIEALRAAIPTIPPPMPIDPSAPVDPNAPVTGTTSLPAPAPTPSIAGLSPRRMYDQAFADYAAGQFSLAIQGYDAFLRTFPASDLADDAQLAIGESNFAASKYQDAVNAYNEVIKRYPTANATPDAYYKRGLAQEKLGDIDAARESWQTAVKNYEDSDAGRLAQQGLDRLAARKP